MWPVYTLHGLFLQALYSFPWLFPADLPFTDYTWDLLHTHTMTVLTELLSSFVRTHFAAPLDRLSIHFLPGEETLLHTWTGWDSASYFLSPAVLLLQAAPRLWCVASPPLPLVPHLFGGEDGPPSVRHSQPSQIPINPVRIRSCDYRALTPFLDLCTRYIWRSPAMPLQEEEKPLTSCMPVYLVN